MKAFLLAAGLGTRLRPITNTTPKCMLVIDDRPMLDIWLDAFDAAGVDEVLVNLHHLPEAVTRHLTARTAPPSVRTVFEPELLGSAGTLLANRTWVEGEELFLACNADNLTDFDLRSLIDAHAGHDAIATWTLFHSPNASGRSRHGEPVRTIHNTPSTNIRLSRPVEPRWSGRPMIKPEIRSHCASLRTSRSITPKTSS